MSRANGAIATYAIMAITLVVFVVQLIPGLGATNALLYAGVFSAPDSFEPWRMLTTMFVHSTGMLLHVGLNMYTLWIFGRLLEPFIGTWRFVALYLISGLAGSVGVLWLADPFTPVVGASGAIFGVIGAFLVIHRSLGGNATQLYLLVGLNLVIGFLPGAGIAWQAHIGGLVGGAAIGWLYANTRRPNQQAQQRLGLLGITFALLVLSLRYVVLGI
ncbi:MAG: rhomboid family intramembrane serine protease [Microbacteriaceae bacterium]